MFESDHPSDKSPQYCRGCLYRTMDLLRQYTMGSGEVEGAELAVLGKRNNQKMRNNEKYPTNTSNIKLWTGWISERFLKVILRFCL